MKISHEVPLALLERSLHFNDYQYILPHLADLHPKYKEFMLKYRQQEDSFSIMDNGLFEGVIHTIQDLVEKINLFHPDIFIVPDEWNNKCNTYKNAKYWFNVVKNQLPQTTNLMVVLQGETIYELAELYMECADLGYKYFAFNHSSEAYQSIGHPNKLINQTYGRQRVVNKFINDGLIKDNHYIHLLGASTPQEFLYYKHPYFNCIKSVDTSSPIINGMLDILYDEHGLFTKPSNKIEEFFESSLEDKIGNIIFNINKFREIVG